MVATRVKSQPKSSPATASVTSTPKAGRRLTPASATPTKKRQSVKPATKAKSGPKGKAARAVKDEDDDVSEDPPTPSENTSSSDNDSEDAFNPPSSGSDEAVGEEEEEEESEVDSDFLDESEEETKKRKAARGVQRPLKKAKPSNGKGRVVEELEDDEDEEADASEVELEEGQTIAARIYPAPTTGKVPPGRVSRNTFKFLKNLQIPERNDREWFRSHEPSFRQAENEWKAFVERVQLKFFEVDNEVPILPPKDVIHRIYRDVRFSSDKTPYKKSFSMSTSRGGRKGIWAGYYLGISPNGHSVLAAGVWQPGKDELATIRQNILSDPSVLRDCISRPEFVEMFGPAKPGPRGKRQNVFGHDDALKVAPKLAGVDKTHKDIDLLKLRSIAVVKNFDDEEVLAEDFQATIKAVLQVVTPFVHMLNDLMSLPSVNDGDDDNDDDDDAAADDDDEEGNDED